MAKLRQPRAWIPWAAVIAFILVTGFGARFFGGVGTSGDEPHYLIITQSILEDGDFDIKNNYIDQTYKKFFADDIEPHVNAKITESSDPHWYSVHGPGLSLLLLPFVMLLGYKIGPIVFMIVAEVIAIIAGVILARTITEKKWSLFIGALFALSVQMFAFAGHAYPDMVVGAIVPIVCYLVYRNQHRPWVEIVIGLLCVLLAWLHVRMGLVAGSVILIALWNIWKLDERRSQKIFRTFLLLSPFVLGLAMMQVLFYNWFQAWTPLGIWKGDSRMFMVNPLKVLLAWAFDPSKGVMILSPIWFMAVIGFIQWFRQGKRLLLLVLAVTLPSILLQANFLDWGAGWCPPGRYLVDFLPAFLPAIIVGFQEMINYRLLKGIAYVLAGIQATIAFLTVYWNVGLSVTGGPSPFFITLKEKLHLDVLPVQFFNFQADPSTAGWILSAAGTIFALFLVIFWKKAKITSP